jgi:hypothetical protein
MDLKPQVKEHLRLAFEEHSLVEMAEMVFVPFAYFEELLQMAPMEL